MKTFKSISATSKTGNQITIRVARKSDAQSVYDLARAMVAEDSYQLVTTDELQITPASEAEWIALFESQPNRIILLAEYLGTIIGQLDFCNGNRARTAHVGEFGMSVAEKFRDQGVGRLLVKALLEWATDTAIIEKIALSVHSTNARAIALYKSMGFEIEGVKTKDLKYDGGIYIDTIMMSRFVH